MAYQWKDKIVLVTGAATGIGAALTRILMGENAKHVAVLDINDQAGVALQDELNAKYGAKVKFYKCDVTNEEQLDQIFKSVVEEQRYLDVVVNNAGIMNDSLETYRKMIDINVTALCSGTIKAIEIMSKEKGGKGGAVINISSVAALMQSPCITPIYNATKSAVLQFSNCVGGAGYYPRNGVRVIAMCFGATDTPLLHLDNIGNFDKTMESQFADILKDFEFQKLESAAQGVVDAFKKAESGSTWLVINNKPVENITPTINQAYGLMSNHVFC